MSQSAFQLCALGATSEGSMGAGGIDSEKPGQAGEGYYCLTSTSGVGTLRS